jgi:hypothetical protein
MRARPSVDRRAPAAPVPAQNIVINIEQSVRAESSVVMDYAPPPRRRRQEALGLGLAAFILGLIGIVLAFIPCIGVFSFPLSGLAILLGFIGLFVSASKAGRGLAIAGLATGVAAVAVAVIWLAVLAAAADRESKRQQESPAPVSHPRRF